MTTEELYIEKLKARQAGRKFDPHEIRLSEVGHSLRAATLRMLDYPALPTTLEQESIFLSGDEHEEHLAALWEERYPGGIDRQVVVRHPWGEGHMDIWVRPIRHYVEAKTTKKASRNYLPLQAHVDQVQLYHHFFIQPTGGGTAEIAYRIKETGMVVSKKVKYDPVYVEELLSRIHTMRDAVDLGVPLPVPEGFSPDRFPCAWPGPDGKLITCPYWNQTWNIPDTSNGDAAIEEALALYKHLDHQHRRAKELMGLIEDRLETVQGRIAQLMDERKTSTFVAHRFRVHRSFAAGRTYWNVPKAIKDGVVSQDAMTPYESQAKPSTRWTAVTLPDDPSNP